MSTIKEKLRDAIENKNWALAVEAYESLTGEKVKIQPEHIFTMNETRGNTPTRLINPKEVQSLPVEDKGVDCQSIDVTNTKRFNMFFDDGKEAQGDKKLDRLLKPENLTEKGNRPLFKLVEVTCSKCKGDFEAHPEEKKGYVCQKCSTRMES